jgi:hypothetical protein
MAGFLTAAAAVIGESGIGGAIVRILIAYGISRLINGNTGSANNTSAPIDKGVRLQLSPDTTNPVPVVYGSTYVGPKVTDAQITDANKTMWYCLTIAEATDAVKLSDGTTSPNMIDEIYMNNSRVVLKSDGVTVNFVYTEDPSGIKSEDINVRDLVQIYLFSNGSATPILPTDAPAGSTVPTADARTLMPGWTNDSRMTNLTFALIKLTYNSSKGITALPTFQFKVTNTLHQPGDVIYDYLTRDISGAGLDSSVIDTASLTALNTYSNMSVNYIDQVTGSPDHLIRYKINGLVDPAKNVFTNLQSMVNAAGSFINYDITSGKWNVIINKNNDPVLNFDDSNILGGITLTGTSLDQIFNSVEVTFPHRELQSQQDTVRIDIPRDGNSFLNPNEPENILKISYDLVDEPLQALELGYIELYQNRMDQVITFTTDYSKFQVEAADVITVTNSIYGWDHNQFRVVRVREIESDAGGLALEITAQEYDPYIYTAMGTPIRPGVPVGPVPPPIGVIGTPAAPTITYANNIAIPAVTINGLTPSGVVDRFEFWISTDNQTFNLLGTDINSNGEIFDQHTPLSFTTFTLTSGTYYFQVRGANKNAVGAFSPSSTAFTWAPVASVNPNSSIDPGQSGLSSLLPLLGIGSLAYLGYKYLYPELLSALSDTELGKLLGIEDPAKVAATKAALDNPPYFKIVQVDGNLLLAAAHDTLEFTAGNGIEISADEATNNITIGISSESTAGVTSVNDLTGAIKIVAGTGITISSPNSQSVSIAANGSATGNVTVTTTSAQDTVTVTIALDNGTTTHTSTQTTLPGTVFPCIYGTGDTAGFGTNASRLAIFTHDYMVFGTPANASALRASNVLTAAGDQVYPNIASLPSLAYNLAAFKTWSGTTPTGTNSHFPQTYAWTTNDYLSEEFVDVVTVTDSAGNHLAQIPYAPATGVATRLYYTKCTYDSSKPLREQAWGAWNLFYWDTEQVTVQDGTTNPPPPTPDPSTYTYKVDIQFQDEGIVDAMGNFYPLTYDPFLPDRPKYKTVTQTVYHPDPSINPITCSNTELVAFGISCFKLPDQAAFASNTIWGYEQSNVILYGDLPIVATAYNGSSMYVGITNLSGGVYYSTDGKQSWSKVMTVNLNSTNAILGSNVFKFVAYGASKFWVWQPGDAGGGCAYSTDGMSWTEAVSNLDASITSIKYGNSSWIGTGSTGLWTSSDGITWTKKANFQ